MGGGVGGMVYSLKHEAGNVKLVASHANHRGDIIARSDNTGSLTSFSRYEAYGKRPYEWGSDPDRQKANTKEEEKSLGLLNEGMRYRDLETGTFLTGDPIGFKDGPNIYCYVHCNPITHFDPYGLKEGDWWDVRSYSTLPQEIGKQTLAMGNRLASGAKEGALIGSDLIAFGVVSAGDAITGGNVKESFQGQSQLVQNMAANPSAYNADQMRSDILVGTGKEVANIATLGMAGMAEGFGEASKTGDFSQAQDRSLEAVLLTTGANNALKNGQNPFTGSQTAKPGGCFIAGTRVSTPEGDRNIEDLKPGDTVFAYNQDTASVTKRTVLKTFKHFTHYWVDVQIGEKTIKATRFHKFWVENERAWVDAIKLEPGMVVLLQDGTTQKVESVSVLELEQPEDTYNLLVDVDHNYFVGTGHVLVHNGAPDYIVDPAGTAYPVPEGATGPTPVINQAGVQTGSAFTGGTGGANGQVATMRIMNPTPARGNSPEYSNGYIKYENANQQGVDPYTGRTLPNSESHHPIGAAKPGC